MEHLWGGASRCVLALPIPLETAFAKYLCPSVIAPALLPALDFAFVSCFEESVSSLWPLFMFLNPSSSLPHSPVTSLCLNQVFFAKTVKEEWEQQGPQCVLLKHWLDLWGTASTCKAVYIYLKVSRTLFSLWEKQRVILFVLSASIVLSDRAPSLGLRFFCWEIVSCFHFYAIHYKFISSEGLYVAWRPNCVFQSPYSHDLVSIRGKPNKNNNKKPPNK